MKNDQMTASQRDFLERSESQCTEKLTREQEKVSKERRARSRAKAIESLKKQGYPI
ncbi:MAG: hypothetical protein SOR89_00145 [Ndongobacter sp.]|nr:hypothetical protein [Ndongobacter sp.]